MKHSFLIAVALLTISICGCKKEAFKGTSATYNLKGSVLLFDEGDNILNNSGMTVTLENSIPAVSTLTNTGGDFALSIDTSLHSFALVYSKPSYGTFKRYYELRNDSLFVYLDGMNLPVFTDQANESLGQKSSLIINSLTSSSRLNGVDLHFTQSSNSSYSGDRYIQIFCQKNIPNLSYFTMTKSNKNMSLLDQIKIQNGYLNYSGGCTIIDSCLKRVGNFNSGDTIYFVAYGDSRYRNKYWDKTINEFVFPNVNTTTNITPVYYLLP